MSKPTNKHPYRLGNEHGEIKFGHIIKEKQFGTGYLEQIFPDLNGTTTGSFEYNSVFCRNKKQNKIDK